MTEVVALARLSISRYRVLLLIMIGLMIAGLCGTLASMQWFGEEIGTKVGGYAIFFSLLPSGVAAIALFDYGLDHDLSHPDSGCSHWLLRQPIRSWKIATVPIVFKTAWISSIWIAFALIMRSYSAQSIPIILPCISFSAVLIWIMVLSWRPFSRGRYKLASLLVVLPVSYGVVAGGFVAPFIEYEEWRPTAILGSWTASLAFFLSGIWTLLNATKLARITPVGSSLQKGLEIDNKAPRFISNLDNELAPSHPLGHPGKTGPLRSLIWHDFVGSKDWIRQVYLVGLIPGTILYSQLTPLHPVSVIGMFFGIIYLAIISNSKHLIQGNEGNRPVTLANHLPTYLATKPISTKAIAWGRQIVPLTTACLTYLWTLVVIGGWSLRESNRTTWMRWATDQAAKLEQIENAWMIGIQLSAAIVLGVGLIFVTRILAHAWVPATGRAWVTVANSMGAIICLFTPLIIFLRWFLSQTDWETTEQSAMKAAAYIPIFAATLLILKVTFVVTIGGIGLKRRIFNGSDLLVTLVIWFTVVVVVSLVFHRLIPHDLATLKNCMIAVTLVIPLSRWLGLPLAVAWNRHR